MRAERYIRRTKIVDDKPYFLNDKHKLIPIDTDNADIYSMFTLLNSLENDIKSERLIIRPEVPESGEVYILCENKGKVSIKKISLTFAEGELLYFPYGIYKGWKIRTIYGTNFKDFYFTEIEALDAKKELEEKIATTLKTKVLRKSIIDSISSLSENDFLQVASLIQGEIDNLKPSENTATQGGNV